MNKSTLRRLEDKLLPRDDLVRLVVLSGRPCKLCGNVHADFDAFRHAHPGPHPGRVVFLETRVVKAKATP